jgi:hypothetical protein
MDMKRLHNNNILKYETNNAELLGPYGNIKRQPIEGWKVWWGGEMGM